MLWCTFPRHTPHSFSLVVFFESIHPAHFLLYDELFLERRTLTFNQMLDNLFFSFITMELIAEHLTAAAFNLMNYCFFGDGVNV